MPLSNNLTSKYALVSDTLDSQGNYNGTNVGVTFASDAAMGDVAIFAGGDYFDIPAALETGITTSYTLSVWINPDAITGTTQALFSDHVSGSTYPSLQAQLAGGDSGANSGKILMIHRSAGSAPYEQHYSTAAITPSAWTLVTFVFDGTTMKIYFNGVLDSTGAMTMVPWNNPTSLRVGRNSTLPSLDYAGKMSDIRFWTDRALTDADISQLSLETGLVAKYALDDAAESVSSNDLSASGTVSYGVDGSHTAAEFALGELESANVIDLTGPATVSFWAKKGTPYSYSGNTYSSFFRWGTSGLSTSYFDFYLLNGKIRSYHKSSGGASDNRGTVSVPAGWNHYAITFDPTTGSKIIYLNGVAQALTGTGFSGAFAAPQKMFLGNISNGNAAFRLNGGKIDDTRAWSRTLSASAIASLFAAGAEEAPEVPLTLTDGLVATWNFDADGSDSIGSNDFTPFNGTTHETVDGKLVASFPNSNSAMYVSPKMTLGSTYTLSVWFKKLKDRNLSHGNYLQLDAISDSGALGAYSGPSYGNIMIYTADELGCYGTAPEHGGTGAGFVSSGYAMTQALYGDGTGWHNLVATYDGTSLRYYINGSQVGNTIAYIGSGGIQVLNGWSNYARAFADYIDDVRIWSRALSANEAASVQTTGPEVAAVLTLTDGLVAKYPLDSDGAPTVGSVTFTGVNGVTHGAGETFATFPNRNSGYYVNQPALDLADKYTLSFWFKDMKDRAAAQSNFLMATAYNKETFGSGGYVNWDAECGLDVTIYTNDELGSYGYANPGAGVNTVNSTGYRMTQALYTGTGWHHMACVFDSGQMTYYINGVQVGNPVSYVGQDKLQVIGSYSDYNYGAFDQMDDFRVWNRALSPADTAALHAAGAEGQGGAPAEDPPASTDPRNLPTTSVSSNQVARWLFEDDYIDDAAGGSGLVFGAVGSPSFVDGKHAGTKAVQLDQGDYFTFPSTLSAASVTGWSFAVWVKEDGNGTQTNGPYGYEGNFMTDHTAVNASKSSINLPHANSYTMWDFDTVNSGGGQRLSTNAITFADFTDWVHVVATKDKASGLMKLYKNGALVSSGTRIANLPSITTAFKFGYGWAGIIDSIEIYNKSLSDAEVSEVYSASEPLPAASVATTYSAAGLLEAGKYMVFLGGKLLSSSGYTITDGSIQILDPTAPGLSVGNALEIIKIN